MFNQKGFDKEGFNKDGCEMYYLFNCLKLLIKSMIYIFFKIFEVSW